jgi:HSP20 family molecular chaperone IbpA
MAENALQNKETNTEVIQPQAIQSVYYTPRVDIVETDEELVLFADVPGVKAEVANIRYENGELILHARANSRHPDVNYLIEEYGTGDFYRAFSIPDAVDGDKISAELKNGVLTVHLPKTEAVKPKKINVRQA